MQTPKHPVKNNLYLPTWLTQQWTSSYMPGFEPKTWKRKADLLVTIHFFSIYLQRVWQSALICIAAGSCESWTESVARWTGWQRPETGICESSRAQGANHQPGKHTPVDSGRVRTKAEWSAGGKGESGCCLVPQILEMWLWFLLGPVLDFNCGTVTDWKFFLKYVEDLLVVLDWISVFHRVLWIFSLVWLSGF